MMSLLSTLLSAIISLEEGSTHPKVMENKDDELSKLTLGGGDLHNGNRRRRVTSSITSMGTRRSPLTRRRRGRRPRQFYVRRDFSCLVSVSDDPESWCSSASGSPSPRDDQSDCEIRPSLDNDVPVQEERNLGPGFDKRCAMQIARILCERGDDFEKLMIAASSGEDLRRGGVGEELFLGLCEGSDVASPFCLFKAILPTYSCAPPDEVLLHLVARSHGFKNLIKEDRKSAVTHIQVLSTSTRTDRNKLVHRMNQSE
uniref:ANK_REP_REGION domain-containing protein n=1 Tax=Steinernema glaseri TaxID=37863 RepID=A0A1I8ALK8_9BILA